MAEPNAADVLNQDGPVTEVQVNAEEPVIAEPNGGDEADPQANANEAENEHKRKGGWQRRIEKQEKLIESLVQALSSRAESAKPEAKPEPTVEAKEPDPNDFETVAEYLKAANTYNREQIRKEVASEIAAKEKVKEETTAKQTVEQKWSAKLDEARKTHADFDEVIAETQEANIPISQAMADVLMRNDLGGEMFYYLGKHHDEAISIARMSPLEAAMALGEIKARLTSTKPKVEEEATPPPPTTKAPAPITPVKRTATAPVDLESASFKDFVKAREAHLQRK